MAVDAIVRVSFQSDVNANQAANKALVGHAQDKQGSGPFEKIGTAVYSVSGGDEAAVSQSIADLGHVLAHFYAVLDFVSVSYARRT